MSFEGIFLNRPILDSFDSGYEHSLEHLIDLKQMLAEEAEEGGSSPAMEKSMAMASPAA